MRLLIVRDTRCWVCFLSDFLALLLVCGVKRVKTNEVLSNPLELDLLVDGVLVDWRGGA